MPCERKHIKAIETRVRTLYQHTGMDSPAVLVENCFHAIDAALAAIEESPWRTMESAPKDDTEVLLYLGKGRIEKAVWWDCYGEWVDTREYIKMRNPTHWMPLPAAPGTDNAASDGGEG